MASPHNSSSQAHHHNANTWPPYYYGSFHGNSSSSLDSPSCMTFNDDNPLKPYATYTNTGMPPYAETTQQSLLPEMTPQDPYMQGAFLTQYQMLYGAPAHSALQDVYRESLFNSNFNETDSSCGSPLFEMSNDNSLFLTISDSRQESFISESSKTHVMEEARPNMNCETPGAAKVKKHKRKHIMNRSKLGCWICRIKHLKCDESKPTCNNCFRFGIDCDYSEERPAYVLDRNLRRQKLDAIITKKRRRVVNPAIMPNDSPGNLGLMKQNGESSFIKQEWMVLFEDT